MDQTQKRIIEDKINEILDKVRPFIKMHGGDVSLARFDNGIATLDISGTCVGCSLADLTYNQMIGGILIKDIPEVKKIEISNIKSEAAI